MSIFRFLRIVRRERLENSEETPHGVSTFDGSALAGVEELEVEKEQAATVNRLDALFEWLLAIAMGLGPLLFLPWGVAPISAGKEMALILLAAAAAIAWISRAMATGVIAFTRSRWHIPLAFLLAVSAVSTFFSLLPLHSVWHIESPSESLAGIILAAVLAFLFLNAPRPGALFKKTVAFLLPGAALLGALNIFALWGVTVLPFAFARAAGFNTVGSQNALALFAAFAAIITLSAAKFGWLGRWRYALPLVGFILFANLFLINFRLAWLLLAVGIAVIIGVRLAQDERRDIRRIGLLIPLLVMTLVFGLIRQRLFTSNVQVPLEVSPSRGATFAITNQVWRESPMRALFGSGPATFIYDWEKYRARDINLTAFWGVRFRQGASGAFTTLSTLGMLGFGAYAAVFVFALLAALRRPQTKSPEFAGLLAGGFVLTAAWMLYPANLTLHVLLFSDLGLLIALAFKDRKDISFAGNPRQAVVLALGLIVFLVGIIAGLYRAGERFLAFHEAQTGVDAFNREGNIASALPSLVRANDIAPQEDSLQRLLAEALLVRLQNLFQPNSGASAPDLQGVLSSAIQIAQNAVRLNDLDSNNWATLSAIYENIIPFVEGAENFAIEGYKKWQAISPQNPFPWLAEARASIAAADKLTVLASRGRLTTAQRKELEEKQTEWLKRAKDALAKAIELKGDYADALFLLAQTFDRQGNLPEAVKKAEEARTLDPFGVGTAFQLGFLYYKAERFTDAEQEFARAITIQPNYSNAHYFLGLLYERKGEKQKAAAEFEEIGRLNPQNEEVKRIIANLKAGRTALDGIVPPAPAPEERETPPVQEQQGKEEKTLKHK